MKEENTSGRVKREVRRRWKTEEEEEDMGEKEEDQKRKEKESRQRGGIGRVISAFFDQRPGNCGQS